MSTAPSNSARCPDCGAESAPQADRCWLCGRPSRGAIGEGPSSPQSDIIAAQHVESPWTFSISTLMLLTTLAAVCLGLFAVAPGIAFVLAMVSLPALARTFSSTARRKGRGERPTAAQGITTFAGSVAVVIVAGISAVMAFFATCALALGVVSATTTNMPDVVSVILLIVAVVIPFFVGAVVFRRVMRNWPGDR